VIRATDVPTVKQYALLRILPPGVAGLSWSRRDTDPLLRRNWVTAEWRPPFYQWVRITPDGLRALATALYQHGLPDPAGQPQGTQRVCAGCGGSRWRYETVAEET